MEEDTDAFVNRRVLAAAVENGAVVEQHGTRPHLGRDDLVVGGLTVLFPPMRTMYDPSGAVVVGEIGECPDRAELGFDRSGEGRPQTPRSR